MGQVVGNFPSLHGIAGSRQCQSRKSLYILGRGGGQRGGSLLPRTRRIPEFGLAQGRVHLPFSGRFFRVAVTGRLQWLAAIFRGRWRDAHRRHRYRMRRREARPLPGLFFCPSTCRSISATSPS